MSVWEGCSFTTEYCPIPSHSMDRRQVTRSSKIFIEWYRWTTRAGSATETAKSLDDCVREVTAIAPAGKAVRGDLLVLCHGGPIASPDDAQIILERVREVDGFYRASSMERLPTELAIVQQIRDFMGLKLGNTRS
jgi:predicted TIM-barrel enzyme